MAGHSKWANIRFRKGAQDAKRGKIFTKIIREISVAARMGGPDEMTNSRLRDAVYKGLKANMKRDTIDNAIKRGTGGLDGADMQEMRYEGYGPGGVAVLVDCLSDNKNRTVSEVRHAFTKYAGNLGTDGSVAYLFTERGEIIIPAQGHEDDIMELAIELGAEDVDIEDGLIEVVTTFDDYRNILTKIQEAGFEIEQTGLTMHPMTTATVDADSAETLIKLIDALEDLDDVQAVHCNAENLHEFME